MLPEIKRQRRRATRLAAPTASNIFLGNYSVTNFLYLLGFNLIYMTIRRQRAEWLLGFRNTNDHVL